MQPPTDAGENGGYTGYVISAPYRKGAAPAPLSLAIRKNETIAYGRAIKTDNSLWNWTSGKIVKDISDAAAVAVYSSSAAAIKTDGTLWTESDGEQTKLLDNVAFVSGGERMWAIKNDGTAQYMVYDDLITSPLFTDVVDAAYDYILKSDGVLYRVLTDQWDDDGNRLQRADGTTLSLHENLKLIKKLDNVVSIACAGDYLFAAVRADGTLWYWNELRDADPNDPECAARKVMDNVKAVYSSLEIDGFQNYMGILKNDGSLWMWGRNDYGKLGDGTHNYRYTPEEAVKVLDNVVSVQLVVNTSTALTADGTVWEWGRFSETTPAKVMDGVKLPPAAVPITPDAAPDSLVQPTIPVQQGMTVVPTPSKVFVNGAETSFEAYNIDGSNYFKLRDVAFVLNGTNKQFEVGYDDNTKAITMTAGQPYTPTGGEMAAGDGQAKPATPTDSKIYLDGTEVSFVVYNIGGNNFFKLVDLMSVLNVGVTYNETTGNIGIDTNAVFTGVVTVTDTAPTETTSATTDPAATVVGAIESYTYSVSYVGSHEITLLYYAFKRSTSFWNVSYEF